MSVPMFKVVSRDALEKYLNNPLDCETIIVSITDIRAPLVREDFENIKVHILRLQFSDCEVSNKWEIAMSDEQGDEVAKFVKYWMKNKSIELIIVQCEAGCSRSSGVCAAIMKYVTDDDMQIFQNPKYTPNMNCYRMVYNALFNNRPDENELIRKMEINESAYFKENPDFKS